MVTQVERAGALQSPGSPAGEQKAPPLIVGVAIDESGIGEGDLRRSREMTVSLLRALPEGSLMALGSFSGDKRILLPATADASRLSSALSSFTSGASGVALPDGLFDLVQYLAGLEADARAVVLISAGQVRGGDLHFEDPLNAATARDIRISCVAVGPGDGKLLRRVAKLTGGEYVRLEVADPSLLLRSLVPMSLSSSPPSSVPSPGVDDADESGPPSSRAATGLLGAAAIFFSLGGLLMLGLVLLLVRRLGAPAPESVAAGAALKAPAPAPERGRPPTPADFEAAAAEAETLLEKTLAVNADPLLRALSGPGAGKNFRLSPGGTTTIGRSRRNDVVLPEDAASAQHCRIDREGDSYVLHDLGSTNGVFVNGARTERAVLQHGDRMKVGDTVFTVSLFGDRS